MQKSVELFYFIIPLNFSFVTFFREFVNYAEGKRDEKSI